MRARFLHCHLHFLRQILRFDALSRERERENRRLSERERERGRMKRLSTEIVGLINLVWAGGFYVVGDGASDLGD